MRRDERQDQSGETAGATIFSWVFRLLRALLRRGGQAGGRAVVTGTPPGPGQAIVACLGASATAAAGSYARIADLAREPDNAPLSAIRSGSARRCKPWFVASRARRRPSSPSAR